MSQTSRARHIKSHLVGFSHQRCLALVRGLGSKSPQIARTKGWPLKKADAFLLGLTDVDGEPLKVMPTEEVRCARCGSVFFNLLTDNENTFACRGCLYEENTAQVSKSRIGNIDAPGAIASGAGAGEPRATEDDDGTVESRYEEILDR